MAKVKVEEEYPCGYKYSIEVSSIFLESDFDGKDDEGCPLHGKKCKR
ncbi:hypothetical protein LCGC14_0439020 [marine sediment metagenome]|uniref:Uncharacterized protein n=1 Tax=marine sediment metagenome TaxID=412755 RepID=A0A0F9SRQ7_9ZZZZ